MDMMHPVEILIRPSIQWAMTVVATCVRLGQLIWATLIVCDRSAGTLRALRSDLFGAGTMFGGGELTDEGPRCSAPGVGAHVTCRGGFICVPCQYGTLASSECVVGTMRKPFFELFGGIWTCTAGGGAAAKGGGAERSADALLIEATMSAGDCAYTMHAKSINPSWC